jgi:hypothetical protein
VVSWVTKHATEAGRGRKSENRPQLGEAGLTFTGHRESPMQANQRVSAPRRGLLAVKLLTYKERVEAFRVTDRPSDGDRAQSDGPRRWAASTTGRRRRSECRP